MKLPPSFLPMATLLCVGLHCSLHAQSTAFTYQGVLTDAGSPASGVYDLRFTLYGTGEGATAVAGPITNAAVQVENGLFTVPLDFGKPALDGNERWLEIAVTEGGSINFTRLHPRQPITPTPYAVRALSVNPTALNGVFSNAVAFSNPDNSFSGAFAGDGSGLENINVSTLDGFLADDFWFLGGNGNTVEGDYLGTVDNRPLEFRVDNRHALRIEAPGEIPTIIGGARVNRIGDGVTAAIIAGGSNNVVAGNSSYVVISGGVNNDIGVNADGATIGGGTANVIAPVAPGAIIAGGNENYIGTVTGQGVIGGGWRNAIGDEAQTSTIAGGRSNSIKMFASHAFIGGGEENRVGIDTIHGSIAGGFQNEIELGADHGAIGGGRNNNVAGDRATVGGGYNNQARGSESTIGGGASNSATFVGSTIAGGRGNLSTGSGSTVGGGNGNDASGDLATVSGGQGNDAVVHSATIGGGRDNLASGTTSTIAGGLENLTGGAYTTIGGGQANSATDSHSVVAGGSNNHATGNFTSVTGGRNNTADGGYSTVAGGRENNAAGSYSFAAGYRARANHAGAYVFADSNQEEFSSTTANQFLVQASGGIGLGGTNTNLGYVEIRQPSDDNGHGLTVANVSRSRTLRLWVDGAAKGHIGSGPTGNTDLVINAGGGNVGIGTTSPATALHVNGTVTANGFNNLSDRNTKENINPVDPAEVLSKVVALPISRWNFKDDSTADHIGPMAQSFFKAFGLGGDNRHIATVDADGVALAAIQGLSQQLDVARAENAGLRERIDRLEQLVERISAQP